MSINTIAGELREQTNPEPFQLGQTVVARFTNSGRVHQFEGVIRGRTANYWKVESITTPYPNEAPGRVFHIATARSRTYSINNKIVSLAYQPEVQ